MSNDPTRRTALTGLAAISLLACTSPPGAPQVECCTAAPGTPQDDSELCLEPTGAQTEGPFYPGEPAQRVDIREGRPGVQLDLDLLIVAPETCNPYVGVEVDLWCADANGDYSGYAEFGTVGMAWLRGQQLTDASGRVRFTAIVPGSYPGRAIHLHVKVRAGGTELTTQIYLPDTAVATVLVTVPYAAGAAQTTNADDNFYAPDTLLTLISQTPDLLTAEGRLIV